MMSFTIWLVQISVPNFQCTYLLTFRELNEGEAEPNPPTMAEVASNSGLVILASSDTTATVLCTLF